MDINNCHSIVLQYKPNSRPATLTSGGDGTLGDLFPVEDFELAEERSSESREC